MPGSFITPTMGVPGTVGLPAVRSFPQISVVQYDQTWYITGVTRNAQGVILGGCTVDLFLTATDQIQKSQISDAVTGVYSFAVQGPPVNYYVVAYLAGAPDVAGTTINTLQGV